MSPIVQENFLRQFVLTCVRSVSNNYHFDIDFSIIGAERIFILRIARLNYIHAESESILPQIDENHGRTFQTINFHDRYQPDITFTN